MVDICHPYGRYDNDRSTIGATTTRCHLNGRRFREQARATELEERAAENSKTVLASSGRLEELRRERSEATGKVCGI